MREREQQDDQQPEDQRAPDQPDAAREQLLQLLGRPLGPASMFNGLAIQILCPRAVGALTEGVPFSFFG